MAKSKQVQKPKRRQAQKRQGIRGMPAKVGLFPDQWRGKMSYGVEITFSTLPATSMSTTVFRLNSVYDPDYTGTGTSAAGYISAIGIYGKYRVLGVKAILSYWTTSSVPIQAFAIVSPDSTIGINFDRALAQRHVWTRAVTGGGIPPRATLSIPIHCAYGVPAATVLHEDDFAATAGASPANTVYLHVGANNTSASASSMVVSVQLIFDVLWYQPLLITQP